MEGKKEQEYLKVYQKVTRMISMMLDHQQVMDTIVHSLPELLAVDAATIRLLDTSTSDFVLGAAHGLSIEYLSRMVIDNQETMEMIRSGYPVAKTDLDIDQNNKNYELVQSEGIKSILTLPILFQDSIIGILRLITRKARIFTSEEISFAMGLAEQVGLAITNARLFNEMKNQVDFMKDVQEISTLVNSSLDLQDILDVIVKRLLCSIDCGGCTIRLLKAQTNKLELAASLGLSDHYLHHGETDIKVPVTSEPVAIYDVSLDDRVTNRAALMAEGITSILSVPIRARQEVIGMIRLFSSELRCFTGNEINFVMTVAEAGGAAIRNAKTYQQITLLFNQIEENERFLTDILNCIRPQLLVVDRDKHLVLVNKSFSRVLGKDENEILGRDYDSLWSNQECNKEKCPVNRVLHDGQPATFSHCTQQDDADIWYERTASPMLGDDGDVEYVIEIIRDITAKKQLENEQLQRVKLQGVVELAGTIAHEINSPLFAALGTAQLLEEDLDSDEVITELETIVRNLQEIKELTKKMTTMTGFESRDYVGETKIGLLV